MSDERTDGITPDTKDWTWVLGRACPDCGLDVASVTREDIAHLLRDNARSWSPVLARPDARRRPRPTTWSPLEYACHVRDVFVVFDERLRLMLREDDPLFPNWDQDATAVDQRYAEQSPPAVSEEVLDAAAVLADRLDRVTDEQWSRPGRRSDGSAFTVESLARYLLHDPVHHLHDVGGR